MTNIKPHLRALFAMAALVAALTIPAQSAIAAENCSSGATASQYCQVKGVNTGSDNNNAGKPDNGNGPTTEAATAEGTTPVAVTAAAVETEAVESSSSSLPFTGLDVGILALVAVALAGTGLLLRRLTASGALRS